MANYMSEVAKLLGVELEEKFELERLPGIPLKLTEDGLECLGPAKMSRDVMNEAFIRILMGCSEIKRIPWKPKVGEVFWYVDYCANIKHQQWVSWDCYNFYKIGNCYRTREEAVSNRDKWSRFYASDEVLEV